MLKKSDALMEQKIIEELIQDDELRAQHELFQAEMQFKQELINARKEREMTQKEMSEKTGLSQQAVSRLEKGTGGTIETVIKYLSALGYSLSIQK